MPEAAFRVGEDRIDGGVVEVENFLARITLVVFGDEIRQRAGNRRTIALGDVAHAGVDRLLRLDQAFLRVGLVIERNDLDLLALNTALGIYLVGEKLERLQSDFPDTAAPSRQRIDVPVLKRLFLYARA